MNNSILKIICSVFVKSKKELCIVFVMIFRYG